MQLSQCLAAGSGSSQELPLGCYSDKNIPGSRARRPGPRSDLSPASEAPPGVADPETTGSGRLGCLYPIGRAVPDSRKPRTRMQSSAVLFVHWPPVVPTARGAYSEATCGWEVQSVVKGGGWREKKTMETHLTLSQRLEFLPQQNLENLLALTSRTSRMLTDLPKALDRRL